MAIEANEQGSRSNVQGVLLQERQQAAFERVPEEDRRIGRGDDFAGDAWRNTKTGEIEWGTVGVDRNAQVRRLNDLDRNGQQDHLLDRQQFVEQKGLRIEQLQAAEEASAEAVISAKQERKAAEYAAMQADPELQQAKQAYEREELQAVLDQRAALAQAVADRSEAVAAAVDRVRDPEVGEGEVSKAYEAAAKDYAKAMQDLREFEAKPHGDHVVVDKFRELQAAEAAVKAAEQAEANARIDGDKAAEQAAQQQRQASQARLDQLLEREGVKLPPTAETERNEIEHGLTPAQIEALVRATKQQEAGREAKAPSAAAAAATPRVGEAHNQVRDQSAFADAQAKDRLVPPEVTEAFKREGQKYVDAQDPKKVAFVDKGNRLQTIRTFDDRAVEAMVAVADARGWSEIKVSGDEAFRRKAWIEAAARGIEVKGYEPTEKDKARAEQLAKESGRANAIEKNEVLEAYRASRDGDPKERKEAARKHPELVNAFALEAAARSFAKQRLHPEAREAFVERIRENIERDLAQGKEIPEVRRRQELDRKQDRGLDR